MEQESPREASQLSDMFDGRLLSLAAGVMIDIDPVRAVSAAAAAGWPACGVWFEPTVWGASHERDIRRRLDDCGLVVLDVEAIIVGVEVDPTDRLIDTAVALGAKFVLFTSRTDDWAEVMSRFERACDRAAQADPSLKVVYEFLPAFPIGSLDDAVRIVTESARPNAGVLVDNLHLRSCGRTPHDLLRFDPHLFPYLQIADAPLAVPDGPEALLHEAREARRWPGDGELPIRELLLSVPAVPVSFEVRSAVDRTTFADPVDRARFGWNRVMEYRA